jgi:hypothetical protein
MTDRTIIGVVLPEGYTSGSDFAKDCNVEVIGMCIEDVFLRAASGALTMDQVHRLMKSNLKTTVEMLDEIRKARSVKPAL